MPRIDPTDVAGHLPTPCPITGGRHKLTKGMVRTSGPSWDRTHVEIERCPCGYWCTTMVGHTDPGKITPVPMEPRRGRI